MFGFSNRLLHAQKASNPQTHTEDEQVKAGREAESTLVEKLKTEGQVPESDIFCKLRIPDSFQTRRHEIDVVILTAYGIYVVEVKNWSGEVKPNKKGDAWIQKKRIHNGENGSSVDYDTQHGNAVDCIKAKANLLRNHLMKNGCCIKEKLFHPRVVFMNSHVKLDEQISSIPEVILPQALPFFIQYFQWSLLGKMTSSIVPAIISGQLSYSVMESARTILNQTGTWDVVILNGGKQLEGDFKGCAHFAPNRQETEMLQFSHQRNPTLGSTWAMLGYSPQTTVTMYCRGGAGWLWHSTLGTVSIPYSADVVFRVAGENSDSKIPANDIDRIVLSV
ncbi:uncharacterized protein [Ptychodera flava]|uniref:uncharacterized protein n=1 Tax=Ptychodera flava TaxID=63121 RepID=UPI00396A0367